MTVKGKRQPKRKRSFPLQLEKLCRCLDFQDQVAQPKPLPVWFEAEDAGTNPQGARGHAYSPMTTHLKITCLSMK
jgi:hypothetical protein